MTVSYVLVICSIIGFVVGFPAEDLLQSGEILQGLARTFSSDELKALGIKIDPRLVEDGYLTVPQLLHKYGYPVQIHEVQTPDGYLLEMHRIPRPGAQPVYLQHGLMDSSAGWVIMGPHSALAYKLYDMGYDVWMGNCRGNRYSRNHIYLDPDQKDFWDFSFHELGNMDAPAMLDHILEKTGYEKVHYVGHSQGTTAFFVMCATRDGYCDKILSMHALAPVAFLEHAKSPFINAISLMLNQMETLLKILGIHEFLPNSDLMAMAGQVFCKEEAVTQALCYNAIFLVTGFNSEQLNKTMLPAILGHVPAGTSTKQYIHYGQLLKSGHFRMFDFGLLKNKNKYGSFKPPSYDLSKVTAPVALHYSMNDWLADIRDVASLQVSLPNVVGSYLVPLPKFNHLDFIFGIDVGTLVYDLVIQVMRTKE